MAQDINNYMNIYKITNKLNGKSYIGQSKEAERRFKMHKWRANNLTYTNTIYQAMRKHGVDNFSFEIIEECASPEELNEAEKFWIAYYDTYNRGYNMTEGGDKPPLQTGKQCVLGYHHTEDAKKRIGEAAKGNTRAKGYRHTEEAKRRIAEAAKGRTAKKVLQMNLTGKPVKVYDSIKQAAEATGIGRRAINNALVSKRRLAKSGGYLWRYWDELSPKTKVYVLKELE